MKSPSLSSSALRKKIANLTSPLLSPRASCLSPTGLQEAQQIRPVEGATSPRGPNRKSFADQPRITLKNDPSTSSCQGSVSNKLRVNITGELKEKRSHRPNHLHLDSSYGNDSSSEEDTFLPRSSYAITPSLLPAHHDDGKLSTFSAVNIILGKTIGVGVYSVPSSIFAGVGSVGMTLLLWIVGCFISFCGLAVYLDLGSALPFSGGERVYLERIYRRPRMLATCMFMAYVVLLGFSTPNCIVLGQYAALAVGFTPNPWNVRATAVAVITVACVIHARFPRAGLHFINVLGTAKMVILAFVIISGVVAVCPTISSGVKISGLTIAQRNFSDIWSGSSTRPYDYATALLKILYCFRGYNTANAVLSEVRNPIPTLKRAAPLALTIVSAGYFLVNVAYFCAVEKEDFRTSGVVVAGHFLTNLFGEVVGEHILPWLIILSAFGNIAATSFAQARVNQELGRSGLLPWSDFWSSSSQWSGSPAAGLLLHWLVSVAVIVLPPPGEIYDFLVDIGGYPVSIISVALAAGLLYLQYQLKEDWCSPIPARKWCTMIFLWSNVLLLIVPWIKPEGGQGSGSEARFPFYAYPATGLGILLLGAYYWLWRAQVKPLLCPARPPMVGFDRDGMEVVMPVWARDSVHVDRHRGLNR
jgi:amino acid transporter